MTSILLIILLLLWITVAEQQKRSGHSYGEKYEQRDAKSNKVSLFCYLNMVLYCTLAFLPNDDMVIHRDLNLSSFFLFSPSHLFLTLVFYLFLCIMFSIGHITKRVLTSFFLCINPLESCFRLSLFFRTH